MAEREEMEALISARKIGKALLGRKREEKWEKATYTGGEGEM